MEERLITKELVEAAQADLKQDEDCIHEVNSGFIDGDGSIWRAQKQIEVSVNQSSDQGTPKVLVRLQRTYGGRVWNSSKRKGNHKAVYTWTIFQNEKEHALLDVLSRHCIVKLWQVEVALLFLAGEIDKDICTDELWYWKENYVRIDIDSTRITPSWLAGFFEAEGCAIIRSNGTVDVMWSQKGCPALLKAIAALYPEGAVYSNEIYSVNGRKVDKMLDLLANHLPEGPKLAQVLILEEHRVWQQQYPRGRITKEERESMTAFRQRRLQNLKKDRPVDAPPSCLSWMTPLELRLHLRSLSPSVDTSGRKEELIERAVLYGSKVQRTEERIAEITDPIELLRKATRQLVERATQHHREQPEKIANGKDLALFVSELSWNRNSSRDCPLRTELRQHGLPLNRCKCTTPGLRMLLLDHLLDGCGCKGKEKAAEADGPRKRKQREEELGKEKIERPRKKARKEEKEEAQ